ncbi:MAG: NADH-ubiquinone oxidoreductase chain N (EC [uncultured Thiotrichaceae bacterium]|uniref:NADH-quinone oxidoreductase subunit N n=1 Tax=uncultured Thiotrichaceae bacterium TaxID=298394 RepID=A0A6S6SQV1_9GAMM|nr:MAG: NADH-ubiquinone oxidoreductase chain N (EC [uncultured Thiotrichaceae bacterium]
MNYSVATPEIFLLAATCGLLLLDLFLEKSNRFVTYVMAQVVLISTILLIVTRLSEPNSEAFNGMFVADQMASLLKISVLVIIMGVFVYSRDYLGKRSMFKGEFYTLGLFATLGMLIMISANTMLVIYLGLELMSLALYALVAFRRDDGRASEAAMKYFVLGAIASGLLLYGMSILYGLSGSIDLHGVATYVANENVMQNVVLLFGLTFIIAGLGFKFGAVPFHMWVPDVYQGAPTAVTMLIGTAPKLAVFAITIRLLVEGMEFGAAGWQQMLILLAVLSLIVGNIVAIAQTNIKRMLAYSTISHMGFILMGILSANEQGYSAAMFYAITYAITSLGGFAIIILLSREGFEAEELTDLKGLNDRHPWYAFMMLLFMFAMAGIPPLVGFYAKLAVLQAVLEANLLWLAIVAVVMSVIGAFYYLRAVKYMYFDKAKDEAPLEAHLGFTSLLSINGLLMLALGIFPGLLMGVCVEAVRMSLAT